MEDKIIPDNSYRKSECSGYGMQQKKNPTEYKDGDWLHMEYGWQGWEQMHGLDFTEMKIIMHYAM
jgi:hypothetical protein